MRAHTDSAGNKVRGDCPDCSNARPVGLLYIMVGVLLRNGKGGALNGTDCLVTSLTDTKPGFCAK